MRFLLLFSVTCMGYAMENQSINTESQPLVQLRQENPIRNAVQRCCDRHCGALILCGVITCVGGAVGAGCWHAGCIGATKTASAIAPVMQ